MPCPRPAHLLLFASHWFVVWLVFAAMIGCTPGNQEGEIELAPRDSLYSLWAQPELPDTQRLGALIKFIRHIERKYPDSAAHWTTIALSESASKGYWTLYCDALTRQVYQNRNSGQFELAEKGIERLLHLGDSIPYPYAKIKAWQYASTLATYRGQPSEALRLIRLAIGAVPEGKMAKARATLINNEALLLGGLARYDTARLGYEQAYGIFTGLNDSSGMSMVLNNLGLLHEHQGRHHDALRYYTQSFVIDSIRRDTPNMSYGLHNIGTTHNSLGDNLRALAYLHRSLEIRQRMNNPSEIASALLNIGESHHMQGDYAEAERRYLEAEERYASVSNHRGISRACINLGKVALKRKDYATALDYLRRSVAICRQIDALDGLVVSYEILGKAFSESGALDSALYYLRLGYEQSRSTGMNSSAAWLQTVIGQVMDRKGRSAEAVRWCGESLAWFRSAGEQPGVSDACRCLADAYFNLGNFKESTEYLRRFVTLRDSMHNQEIAREITRREMQFAFNAERDSTNAVNLRRELTAQHEISRQRVERNMFLGGLLLFLIAAAVLANRYAVLRKQRRKIAEEKKRSDDLLLNILPAETADELKETGTAKARRFDDVTVLFADIQGFTKLASTFSAEGLVEEIDHCFRAFDDLLARYRVEKIKTVGDAYICAAGLPTPDEEGVIEAVLMARSMQKWMQQYAGIRKAEGKPYFELRIGLHTGPVVAGIVGYRKFAYDIWGDTVNIAARMEQHSAVGRINLSESTRSLLERKLAQARSEGRRADLHLEFERRDPIEVKGKGAMSMHYLSTEQRSKDAG